MKPIARRAVVATGAVVLLVIALGAGAWLGADFVGKMYGYQALPRASASATQLHRKLLLLDKDDSKGLREEVNMELDGELLGMCKLVKAPSASASDSIASARAILRRIANYRAERRPSYPEAYASQVTANGQTTIRACLDESRATPEP